MRSAIPPSGIDASALVTVVPANEASWDDLRRIFGDRGYTAGCQCQKFKIGHHEWTAAPLAFRMERLREESHCGQPRAAATSGLVGYLEGEPVGWCAVEPRPAFPRIPPARLAWKTRGEDPADPGVWAVTCFVTRAGFRRRGVSRALARATVEFARERGARALEGYPMLTQPGEDIPWGELHVGSRGIFAEAGFQEVAHPTPRRVVMRIEFEAEEAAPASE